MIISHLRGHPIIFVNGEWLYKDNRQPTVTTFRDRSCGYCGKAKTADGHDGCLSTLPGLMNACCGHGQINNAYVQFLDGSIIAKESAVIILNELKKAM